MGGPAAAQNGGDGQMTPLLRLSAGAVAGIIGMSATYPLDMVRGRLTIQVPLPPPCGPMRCAVYIFKPPSPQVPSFVRRRCRQCYPIQLAGNSGRNTCGCSCGAPAERTWWRLQEGKGKGQYRGISHATVTIIRQVRPGGLNTPRSQHTACSGVMWPRRAARLSKPVIATRVAVSSPTHTHTHDMLHSLPACGAPVRQ